MKILIIHTAFIGDIVLSTPMLKRIKECYPTAKISYVTTPAGASILRNNPNLSEIIEYDKRGRHKGIKGIWQLGKRLRYENFNLVLVPHRYFRSSVLAWLSRAPKRIGYKIASGSFLFTKKIEYDKNKCEVEKLLSFLESPKKELRKNYPIELYPELKNREKIDKIWNENNLENKQVVTIAPGSKWFTKKWPLEYFNELIKKLSEKNIRLVIIGGEEEKYLNIENLERVVDLRGKTTLLDLAEILKRSNVLVSNDSSPIHIASAFKNTHIIAIFGPTVESFGFFPWSLNSEVLQVNGLKCRPCAIHGGKRCPTGDFRCMLEITPNMVYSRIVKSLNLGAKDE